MTANGAFQGERVTGIPRGRQAGAGPLETFTAPVWAHVEHDQRVMASGKPILNLRETILVPDGTGGTRALEIVTQKGLLRERGTQEIIGITVCFALRYPERDADEVGLAAIWPLPWKPGNKQLNLREVVPEPSESYVFLRLPVQKDTPCVLLKQTGSDDS